MRILNMTLRGFRGTIDRTVHFAEDGVTIIEGPNEVGKSSLAEALDLVFKLLDSSKSSEISKVRPVDRDAGPEVEVELVTGPYELTFRKRWLKAPETVLNVRAPHGESLTGREAHERMLAILDETLDRQLWEALRYEQGTTVTQGKIGASESLASALDAAAGGANGPSGAGESRLWDRVEEERLRYVTATGRRSKARSDLDAMVDGAREEHRQIQGQIDAVSAAAESLADRVARRAALSSRLDEHATALAELRATHEQAKAQFMNLQRLQGIERERRSDLERVRLTVGSRAKLVDEVDRASLKVESAVPAHETAKQLRGAAEGAVKLAKERRQEATTRLEVLTAQQVLADRDLKHFEAEAEAELEILDVRLERAQDADRRLRESTSALREITATPEHEERAEALDRSIERARAKLEAQSPPITLNAASDVRLQVDGQALALAAGEEHEVSSGEGLKITVPDLLEITVGSTEASEELVVELSEAQAALVAVLAEAGMAPGDGLTDLRAAVSRRDDLLASQVHARSSVQEILGEGSIADMVARQQDLQQITSTYLEERPTDSTIPTSLEHAASVAASVAIEVEDARLALEAARTELEAAREIEAERRVDEAELRNQVEGLTAASAAAAEALAGARRELSDDDLARSEADAKDAHDQVVKELSGLEATIEKLDAEGAQARFENAEAVQDRLRTESQVVEGEILRLEGSLEAHGSTGLHDRLNDAAERLESLVDDQHRLESLAGAAELLFTTMAGHRDAMKQSYVAPLREQIEALGRTVFGSSLSVELDVDSLSISRRTLDGVTVDFTELSMGAREQLAIISRLAAARVVGRASSERGAGVPVIIDDALGSSDPKRLDSLGVVFSMVAPDTQVIILTCVPDRYENIGSASVVHLERETRAISEVVATPRFVEQPSTPKPSIAPIAREPRLSAQPEAVQPKAAEVTPSASLPSSTGLTLEASRVLEALGASAGPLGKSDILEQSKLGAGEWTGTINALLAAGLVIREGDKRGAKYRLAS